jgi:hypothetical protein
MKRSVIIKSLEEKFGLSCEGQPDAEEIIVFLESQGMLPAESPYYGCPGCSQCNGDSQTHSHEWDHE